MTRSDLLFRPAEENDIDGLLDVMTSAFNAHPGTAKWSKLEGLAKGWQNFVTLEENGEIVAAARIQRDRLRYGPRTELLKADVGYVSVRAERQAQGIGTELMRNVVDFLRHEGFHLSRLGGLMQFYARFGYVAFPRRYYEFPLDTVQAGARTFQPDVVFSLSKEEAAKVRPHTPSTDWKECARLYDDFNANCLGAVIEERPASPQVAGPDESGLRWVYEDDGRLYGFVSAYLHEKEATIVGAFNRSHPTAMPSLLKRILASVYERGITRAVGRFPFDPDIEERLLQGGVGFILHEVHTSPASNMLMLVDLHRFLAAAVSDWTTRVRRLRASHWLGTLRLRIGDKEANIKVTSDGVVLADSNEQADASISLGERDFLLLALGYRSFTELCANRSLAVDTSLRVLLDTILCRRPTATGALG